MTTIFFVAVRKIPTANRRAKENMSILEIIAIILSILTGCALITSLILFACFVVRSIKEKPAKKFLGGFAVVFTLCVIILIVAMVTVVLTV